MGEKIVFEAEVECTACNGTGLYKGMAENRGAAVVCQRCDGSGKQNIRHEYTKFTERKIREGVNRVYATAAGYGITDRDIVSDDGHTIRFSEAGVPYGEWLGGGEPKPIQDLHCPLQHFQQGTDIGEYLKEKGLCRQYLKIGKYIPDCSKAHREECWRWFDKHRGQIESEVG